MEELDINELGRRIVGSGTKSYSEYSADRAIEEVAMKVNEIVEKINKLEKFTGNNLK